VSTVYALPNNWIVFHLWLYPCHNAKLRTKKMTYANTAANIDANGGDTCDSCAHF